MIDEAKLKTVVENMKVEGQTAFVGAMPTGECTLISIATEPKMMGESPWYPVTFRSSDGDHELSLKGLLQAEGLQYSTRDLTERVRIWYALLDRGATAQARKFNYQGKKGKEVTFRKNWKDFNGVEHKKGEKGTIEGHSFSSKMVG